MKLIVLDNGLKVLLHNEKAYNSVYFSISINCGAFFPKEQKLGTAHMLEHNIFSEDGSSREIDEILGEIGTYAEALTNDINTTYSIRTFSEDLPLCINLLFNKVFNAKFNRNFFENEKNVIIEEYAKQRNNIMSANAFNAIENFYSGTFIENSGYGIGTIDQIKNISFEDMIAFYKANYVINNASVIIVGNFNEDVAINAIKKSTQCYNSSFIPNKITNEDIGVNNKKEISILSSINNLEASVVEIVFSGVNAYSSGKWTFECLSIMLSGMSTSSMLKKRLRKELGYIYNCDVSLDSSIPYKGCGTFNIRYYVNSQHIEDSIIEVFSILKNISTHDIDKLLDMSKKCIINNLKIKCENIESFADINSINLMLTNKYFKLEKEIKDISKINTGDILNVINHLLSHKIVISVVGKKINRNKLRNSLESIIV